VPVGATYIEADINGTNSSLTDIYSVKLICNLLWNGTTATLGSVGFYGLNTTSTANATITNSSNTIRVSVTGLAATTYNWTCDLSLKIKN
jgi:hypothetical protein